MDQCKSISQVGALSLRVYDQLSRQREVATRLSFRAHLVETEVIFVRGYVWA